MPPAREAGQGKGTPLGAAAALASAALWAVTNLLLRGQVLKIGGGTANTWRTAFSALCFAFVFFTFRRPHDLFTIPGHTLIVLLASVLLSMVIGDILQFTAIMRLGIALAMPISSCYPLLTLLIAATFLGEPITPRAVGGALLIIAGVVLVALPRRALIEEGRAHQRALTTNHWIGVALALASAICAAGATTLTRVAIRDIDIFTANMLRLPFSAVLCAIIGTVQRRQLPWRIERRRFLPLFLAGLVSMGSGLLYLNAIKLVGAAKTATLNSSAPIFGLIGAVVFLGERPANRNVLGTLIAFLGIALVV
jgi:DME family drug/metabolite transporter